MYGAFLMWDFESKCSTLCGSGSMFFIKRHEESMLQCHVLRLGWV
jgi:hypothetical protein